MLAGLRRSSAPSRSARARTALGLLCVLGPLAALVLARAPRATATAALAPTASGLETLNYYRGLAGLAAVAVNPDWSDGASAHARYTVKTGALAHTEDPASPYYSASGAAAAANSNVALGSAGLSDRDFTELWLQSTFHAVAMLSPRLRQTAFGSYREGDHGAAALDVLRGVDPTAARPTAPLTFPANGTALPLSMTSVRAVEAPDPYANCPGYGPTGGGQPLFALFGSTPSLQSVTLTADGVAVEVCSYSETTVSDPNATTLSAKRAILAKDHAVVLLPRLALVSGVAYTATITTAERTVSWSFSVGDPPPPKVTTTTTVTPTTTPPTTVTTAPPTVTTAPPSPPTTQVSRPATVAGSTYQPTSPLRLVDTRGGPGPVGLRAAGAELVVPLPAGVPSDATAVALNVTVTGPTDGGYVTVWPTGQPVPGTSMLNYLPGETVPNATIVGVGAGKAVSLLTAAPAHLIVDLFGWFTPVSGAVSAGRFQAVPITRVFDTRGLSGGRGIAAGETRPVALSAAGLPADARAVAVNLTVTGGSEGGYLTAWGGGARPGVSNANYRAGDTVANFALVPVGRDASNVPYIDLFAAGATEVVVDVAGYFTGPSAAAATAGLFVAAPPARDLDTRSGPGPVGLLPPGGTVDVGDGRAGGSAAALVTNLTVTAPSEAGYVVAYPTGSAVPWASNLNASYAGHTRANLAITATGSGGRVRLLSTASAHLIADVTGWFRT